MIYINLLLVFISLFRFFYNLKQYQKKGSLFNFFLMFMWLFVFLIITLPNLIFNLIYKL